MNRKFTLEFDECPPLIFVQNKKGNDITVYQDGNKVRGIRSIVIRAGYEDFTTHEIEYLTGATKGDE